MTTTLADTKTTILFPGDNSRSRSRNASAVEERRYWGYDGAFTSREKYIYIFNTANVIYWQLVKYCSISLVFLFSLWAIPWKYGKEDDAEVYKGSEWVKLCLTRWTDQAYMVMRGIVDTLDTGFWLWSCQSREKGEEQSFLWGFFFFQNHICLLKMVEDDFTCWKTLPVSKIFFSCWSLINPLFLGLSHYTQTSQNFYGKKRLQYVLK